MLLLAPLLRLRLGTKGLTLRLLVRLGLVLLSVMALVVMVTLEMLGWASWRLVS
jgi:hypothetical protein